MLPPFLIKVPFFHVFRLWFRGGIDTNEISSKTMMLIKNPGLFFIGEMLDVTGHLGGYNFQWAWSSSFVAG